MIFLENILGFFSLSLSLFWFFSNRIFNSKNLKYPSSTFLINFFYQFWIIIIFLFNLFTMFFNNIYSVFMHPKSELN